MGLMVENDSCWIYKWSEDLGACAHTHTQAFAHSVFIWSREALGWRCWPSGLQSCYWNWAPMLTMQAGGRGPHPEYCFFMCSTHYLEPWFKVFILLFGFLVKRSFLCLIKGKDIAYLEIMPLSVYGGDIAVSPWDWGLVCGPEADKALDLQSMTPVNLPHWTVSLWDSFWMATFSPKLFLWVCVWGNFCVCLCVYWGSVEGRTVKAKRTHWGF